MPKNIYFIFAQKEASNESKSTKKLERRSQAPHDHLACEIQKTPKDQLMNRFLSLTLEAKEAGMVFTDQETDLMAGILVGYMSPTDRGKLKLFRMMSKKLASSRGF